MAFVLVCLAVSAMWNQKLPATTVWSGYDVSFSKPDGVDPLLPQWQDQITSNVAITRVNHGGGLVNALSEVVEGQLVFNSQVSPKGTLWAYPHNNPGKTIAAWNWSNLDFHPWAIAFGGNGNGGPPGQIGLPSVMYSVDDDLYIDVRLTSWIIRTGGGFSYERSAPLDTIGGDFDTDGDIDGSDFLIWQQGESPEPLSAGDLLLWQENYGLFPAEVAFAPIPEPATVGLVVGCMLAQTAVGIREAWSNPRHRKPVIG